MHVLQNCDGRMYRREGYYLYKRGEMGIYRISVVGGQLLLVAEYWWLTLLKNGKFEVCNMCGGFFLIF